MNSLPPFVISDILTFLSNKEVEEKQLVCRYWKRIIEKSVNTLPRRNCPVLKVNLERRTIFGMTELRIRRKSCHLARD